MELVGREIIEAFKAKNADSRVGLDAFINLVSICNAKHFVELKNTFATVDYVKPDYVFDVSSNKCRVIAAVSFKSQTMYVDAVGTHAEYDKWKLKK